MGKRFWQVRAAADNSKVGELLLYGVISASTWWGDEVTPKQFQQDLAALGDISELHVFINSDGGDVFAGQAIYSMLKRHKATVTVYVDGLAASIASVIAMAGDTIIMPRNAMMMIHSPWVGAVGNATDFRKLADELDRARDSIVATYEAKTGMGRDKLVALLDAETWMTAEEAVSMGFADEIEQTKQVAASVNRQTGLALVNGQSFDLSKFRNPPMLASAPAPSPGGPEVPGAPETGLPEQSGGGPSFDVGCRVLVPGVAHMDGQVAGEVREAVLTYAYGIVFDGMEDQGIYHWYVESELGEENPNSPMDLRSRTRTLATPRTALTPPAGRKPPVEQQAAGAGLLSLYQQQVKSNRNRIGGMPE